MNFLRSPQLLQSTGTQLSFAVRRNLGVSAIIFQKVQDPFRKSFLIKSGSNTQKSKSQAGGVVETIEEYRNKLNAEILRIKTQYTQGAKDMNKLPTYAFKDPIIDNPSMEAK
ncbi:ATP5J [Cordylochernes scorpioides]|uniref:ATP5J n=1 Tax=Cordylochernes scorpioides TaxID=51811 RepID=A0ABY6LDT8_9ARAC|nr:ATP5J [Cordylochernes scorpioides]